MNWTEAIGRVVHPGSKPTASPLALPLTLTLTRTRTLTLTLTLTLSRCARCAPLPRCSSSTRGSGVRSLEPEP